METDIDKVESAFVSKATVKKLIRSMQVQHSRI